MTEKKVVLTYDGLKNMEAELENLKTVRRKDVAEKITIPETKPPIAVRETAARKKRNTEGRFVTKPILPRCAARS